MKRFFKENWLVIVTGIVVGIAALLLAAGLATAKSAKAKDTAPAAA